MKKTLAILLTLVLSLALCVPALGEANTELSGTIRFVGPGLFSEAGPDDSEDLITGLPRSGYNHLIEMWNAAYPNVTLEIDAIPWDNWMAVLQTAAAGGTADILLHGSMLAEICEDLTPYLEKDPEVYEALAVKPEVFRPDEEDYTKTAPTGISYSVGPYYAFLDKQLFEEWGVELPTADWTYAEMLELAQKMTGTNPVSGEENYGIWYYGNEDGNIWKIFSTISAAWGFESIEFNTPNKYDSPVNFDTPEGVKVFEYINELYKCTPPSYLENIGNDKNGTQENDIAIYLSEGPQGKYKSTVSFDCVDRYAYIPLPVNEVDVEAKSSSFTGTSSIAIAKNSPNKDLAWEFIKWFVLDPGANQWVIDAGGQSPTFYGLELMDPELPYTQCFNEVFENFWDEFTISQCAAFDTAYGNSLASLSAALTGMYAGTYTPEEAAKYVQDEIVLYQNMYK